MRKLCSIPMLFLIFGTVYAQTQENLTSEGSMCVQVTQDAISLDGECQEFATPCEVPADWKLVSSCDMVREKDFGISLEERMQKRFSRVRTAINAKQTKKKDFAAERNKSRNNRLRSIRRVDSDKKQKARAKVIGKARTSTTKNYSTAARERVKSMNVRRGGYQYEGDTTSAERKERRQSKRRIASRAFGIRTGKLSNKPKWSTQVKKRKTAGVGLKKWKSSHVSALQRKLKAARKKRVYKGPQLQKIYKGGRIQGDLSGTAQTED